MASALGIIDFGRPPAPPMDSQKQQISPDYASNTPKAFGTTGAGSYHSRNTDASSGFRYDSENSENDNNKHIQSVHGSRSSSRSRQGSEAHLSGLGGSGSFAPQQKAALQRQQSINSGSSAKNDAHIQETVMIEERRRKANGDGYTTHRYKRGRMLGKGGFAKVYLCTAMDTGKNYAIKIVPKANLVKERARLKLQTEIKIHRTLKHQNVCEYKHFFEDRENCYILLELCHNQSLNEMIKRRKRLTEPEAAYFMDQMVHGVKYIHSLQVIHRDLKLGNLFLDKDMRIKVGDLGLATRLEDPDEKRKTICGTPNYIAPEVIQNDKSKRGHSFEVDVWSMGVVLYTILVGKPPYEAKDVKATYQRILNNQYSFPEHVPLSEMAMDLIESMLQSNPHERPSLEYIACHPFLSSRNIPNKLPASCLSFPPTWQRTSEGIFILDENNDAMSVRSSKSTKSHSSWGSRASSVRRPFGRKDPNAAKPAFSSKNDVPQSRTPLDSKRSGGVERLVKKTFSGLGLNRSKENKPGFNIFNDKKDDDITEAALVEKTKNLALSAHKRNGNKSPSMRSTSASRLQLQSATPSPPADDYTILKNVAKRLDTVLEAANSRRSSFRAHTPKASIGLSSPSIWVTRYVDYTSKYGLGFLLNNGTSGVAFNDSTKMALERDGENFKYIERKRGANGMQCYEESSHSLSNYPESLNKKATLMKHFSNYLEAQEKSANEAACFETVFSEGNSSALVYIKKWIRTKHCILFRLNDNTFQIVFYDQTEILLTPDESSITYVDKSRNRKTYFLTEQVVLGLPELEKRIKYGRDVLSQLASR